MTDTDTSLEPEIILDLSRLLSRILHPTPTGVDRCEMAYARGLLQVVPDRLSFAAVHPAGMYGRLSRDAVIRFLDHIQDRWLHLGVRDPWEGRRFAASALTALRPRLSGQRRTLRPAIYLQASPNNLTQPRLISTILKRERAKFICLVHDIIPLQFPEYARPNGAAKHRQRIDTITALADGIIANSQATLDALQPYFREVGRNPPKVVAHLGTEIHVAKAADLSQGAYFVCVGTIEPRKNHLLLLNIWRQLSEEYGPINIPKLLIIGRRGWENEQVIDMLERCPALCGCVEELQGLPDSRVHALLANARALLLPSFAEGYGMPVTEALALGTPVICSDLPALREAGDKVPMFLNPLDGLAWRAAILDFARESSTSRTEQLDRLRAWEPPTWSKHLANVGDLLHRVAI